MAVLLLVSLFASWIIGTSAEIPEVANEEVRNFLETYDRSQSPPSDGPTSVRIGIYANDFRLYEKQSVLEMVMYLRVAWQDERLKDLVPSGETKMKTEVTAHKYFWKPDVFFRNQRASDKRSTVTDEALMSINSTGHVWYVTAHISTFNCPDLPREYHDDMPSVTCSIMIESFSHTMDTLVLEWLDQPIDVDPGVRLLDFSLTNTSLNNCSQTYTAGSFPCLEIIFHIERNLVLDNVGRSLYVSSAFLVIAAWGGFWLDGLRHMTARLILGLGTTAVLVLELAGAASWYEEWDLMGKKTQFWLTFCALLASITVCELTIAHILLTRFMDKVKGKKSAEEKKELNEGKPGRFIDLFFSLVLFPLIFFIFIIVFFVKK